MTYQEKDVPLYDGSGQARWFEHPVFGRQVDIAALDVTEGVSGFRIAHANILEHDAVLDVSVSQDVFVVGFPFGKIAGAPAPIWKRRLGQSSIGNCLEASGNRGNDRVPATGAYVTRTSCPAIIS